MTNNMVDGYVALFSHCSAEHSPGVDSGEKWNVWLHPVGCCRFWSLSVCYRGHT